MNRTELIKNLEGRGDGRIPIWYDYFAEETRRMYDTRIDDLLARYSDDFVVVTREDEEWNADTIHASGGVGSIPNEYLLADWADLEAFLAGPLSGRVGAFSPRPRTQQKWEQGKDKYTVGHWWYGFAENLSLLRGPADALTDVLLEVENVNRLFDGLAEYFISLIGIIRDRYSADAVWIGDDYGMQDRPIYSPGLFRDLFLPRIRYIADYTHSLGMKLFWHSCGNVEVLIPYLIEAGVDVLHPIQPGIMNAPRIVKEYGGDIGFFIGMDVQNLLTSGTPLDISKHVAELFQIFRPARRGLLASMSNTIMPETPWENIEALFESLQRESLPG